MNQGRTVFSQLISFLPDREFRRCFERYQGDIRLRGFSAGINIWPWPSRN
jgi:hypothetical protein